jgi:hypothetical protein
MFFCPYPPKSDPPKIQIRSDDTSDHSQEIILHQVFTNFSVRSNVTGSSHNSGSQNTVLAANGQRKLIFPFLKTLSLHIGVFQPSLAGPLDTGGILPHF